MRAALTVMVSGPGLSPKSGPTAFKSGRLNDSAEPGAITFQAISPPALSTSYTNRSTAEPPGARVAARPLPSQVEFGAGVVNLGTSTKPSISSGSLESLVE